MRIKRDGRDCVGCCYLRQMTATEEDQIKEPVCAFNRLPIRELKVCLVEPRDEPIIFSINGKTPQSVVSLDRL